MEINNLVKSQRVL